VTYAEFLAIAAEFDLPIDHIQKSKHFWEQLREIDTADFRRAAREQCVTPEPSWQYDERGLHDGQGNRQAPSHIDDGNDSDE
jgi:hypothetical protein